MNKEGELSSRVTEVQNASSLSDLLQMSVYETGKKPELLFYSLTKHEYLNVSCSVF